MEKPNEALRDEILMRAEKDGGGDIEIRRGWDGAVYLVEKDTGGNIQEVSSLVSPTNEGEIREYFSARGIALTDDDIKNIQENFTAMQEEKEDEKLDALLDSVDENTSTEQ